MRKHMCSLLSRAANYGTHTYRAVDLLVDRGSGAACNRGLRPLWRRDVPSPKSGIRPYALLAFLMLFINLAFAETYHYQGFEENASDTWNYTANPISTRSIYWGRVNTTLGSANPYQGDWYWASWDLDNFPSSLTFDNVQLPLGYSYQLSFYYFTAGLSPATEYSRYSLSIDGGATWGDWTNLLPNTNAWTLATVDLPAYATQVMLKVEARHDGIGKFAHWDHFTLSRESVEPTPPMAYNVNAAQRTDGSRIVDINYSLFDANNDNCTISLLLATGLDAPFDYSPNVANLSGDIGSGIAIGDNKHISWNAGAEGINYDGVQYKVRIVVEDGTNPQVATPVFDPPGGTYTSPQTVSIACATNSAQIYYTLDGSEPDQTSELYTNPFVLDSPTTLKAKAYRTGWLASDTALALYESFIPENFVLVEGGTFNNGTSNVTVSSFIMAKYEVTQDEYLETMGYIPGVALIGGDFPVYNVPWYNAIQYCNLRSLSEGLIPAYTINGNEVIPDWSTNGYRLPTEAEWEYAFRGGNQSNGYIYSGSNNLEEVGWYESNSGGTIHNVGTKAANELGIYDMSGNVYEWAWDWYDAYPQGPQINPTGPISGILKVIRSGHWNGSAANCRYDFRIGYGPTNGGNCFGFRICKSAP